MKTASFPDKCKCLKTSKNFRPISLLPLISKITEWIIYYQTLKFLSDNNVLYKFQLGFRKFISTDSCLSNLYHKMMKDFDSGLLTGMVLIGLQKTLYTGDYNILIKKMLVPVLTDETINWYIPYLSNRNFCIETASSEKAPITYGVPQG